MIYRSLESEMMKLTEIEYTVADRVATLTLNRPDRLNAWTPTMATELRAAVEQAEADDAVRAIVLTGAGRGFCAGADTRILEQRATGAIAPAHPGHNRFDYLVAAQKPLIAAVNGPVVGIGLVATLYCDMRFLAAGAKISTSFARRGLPAEYGSAWLLQRLIGPMHAADLLLTGRMLLAEEAAAMGLGKLLPAEGVLPAVMAVAREIATFCSPRAIRVIKRQLALAWEQTLVQAMDLSEDEIATARQSEDFREGVAHHIEKRMPNFSGR
jgi:enoyl-CoA hydratase/carnithine racemase